MSRTLIYIEGQLVDLYPDTVIATTLKTMSMGDVKGRVINHTNRITVPSTATNRKIFGHAQSVKSSTKSPYRILDVRVVQEGIEIIREGVAIIAQATPKSFSIEIYEGLRDFFEKIKGRYVDELDFEIYSRGTAGIPRTGINPVGSPVIDYGRMTAPNTQVENNTFEGDIFEPWENVGDTGRDWVNDSVTGKICVELQTLAPNNESKALRAPYKFYSKQYRFNLSFTVVSGTTTGNLVVRRIFANGDPNAFSVIGPIDISATGDYVIDVTFNESGHDAIEIIAEQDTIGTIKKIVLNELVITPIHSINVHAFDSFPVFGYKSIIQKIIENAGYQWDNLFKPEDQDFLDRLAITFSKKEIAYTDRFIRKYSFRARAAGGQSMFANNVTYTNVEFTDVLSNLSGFYNPSTSRFEVPMLPFQFNGILHAQITVNITAQPTTPGLHFVFTNGTVFPTVPTPYETAGVIPASETITTTGTHTFVVSMPYTFGKPSVAENFAVSARGEELGNVFFTITEARFFLDVLPTPGERMHMSAMVLPDMKQDQFFADFLFRFALLFHQQGNVISTKPLKDILNFDVEPLDWTDKRDKSFDEDIEFDYQNYAKVNRFQDTSGEYASGVFEIDNDTLEEETTVYTSPFVAPEYVSVGGIRVVRVPVFDIANSSRIEASDNWEPGIRLLYLRDPLASDPPVRYGLGSPVNDYLVAVYDDPVSDRKIDWQYLVDNYYREFVLCLNEVKIVKRRYMLSPQDIASIDFFRLVYDDGVCYKIESIDNYVPGKPTKVTLFKVIGRPVRIIYAPQNVVSVLTVEGDINTSWDPVSVADSYDIERSENGGDWVYVDTVSTTSYIEVDTGQLVYGADYQYRIKAYDGTVESEYGYGNTVTFTP